MASHNFVACLMAGTTYWSFPSCFLLSDIAGIAEARSHVSPHFWLPCFNTDFLKVMESWQCCTRGLVVGQIRSLSRPHVICKYLSILLTVCNWFILLTVCNWFILSLDGVTEILDGYDLFPESNQAPQAWMAFPHWPLMLILSHPY